jgi:cytochrome P450
METLARPYALAAVCALLGVEAPDSDKFRPVSDAVLYAMDAGLRPERVQTGISARAELASMVESWSTERSDGLLGDLLSARALDPALVRNTARVFFQGGYSTLFAGLGNVANLIFGDPALQEMCATADEPERQAIMQEGLRLDGPVQASARVLLDDRSIRGVDLRAGETVLSLFAAANHDSEVFSEPDLFLLNRAARSVAFGHRTHACTAASFAVVAMSSLFAALLRDGRRYKLEGPRQRRDTATLRSFACLGYGPAGLG